MRITLARWLRRFAELLDPAPRLPPIDPGDEAVVGALFESSYWDSVRRRQAPW